MEKAGKKEEGEVGIMEGGGKEEGGWKREEEGALGGKIKQCWKRNGEKRKRRTGLMERRG